VPDIARPDHADRVADLRYQDDLPISASNNNWLAAYAYWILKLRGFDNVTLLDGGRKKWELESRDLTVELPTYDRTGFTLNAPEREHIRIMRDELLSKVSTRRALIPHLVRAHAAARLSRGPQLRRLPDRVRLRPEDHLHHKFDRVAELSAAEDHQEPRSFSQVVCVNRLLILWLGRGSSALDGVPDGHRHDRQRRTQRC
jgi:hypothetical protein